MNINDFSTKQLLTELFDRYEEGIFIGNPGKSNLIHMSSHFPTKATGMHSILIVHLTALLTDLKKKYNKIFNTSTIIIPKYTDPHKSGDDSVWVSSC